MACQPKEEKAPPEVRPVRTVTVEKRDSSVPVVLTGRIQADDEVSLAFRISGRMVERTVNLGDQVKPDQVVARLEPQNEMNALRAAQANLAAAEGQLAEANAEFGRQQHLSERGFAAQAVFDRARQAQQTAQSAVEAATAMLKNAKDQVSFTELRADAEGVVTAVSAEPGEVVQAGQRIIQLARQDGRDAVFDVPAQVIRSAPPDPLITVFLTDDPTVKADGRVREVAPQADPVTRTFEVKVGLSSPPPEMRLGATVTGRMQVEGGESIEIPATALTRAQRRAGRLDRRSGRHDGHAPQHQGAALRPRVGRGVRGLGARRDRGHGGGPGPPPGPEGPPAQGALMKELNLSGWALKNKALVVYFMIVAVVAGVAAFFSLGRNEDPSFTIKTMVVQAAWPGATIEDTEQQVTERIERKLQELPGLDNLRSFTRAGSTTIFVDLKGAVTAPEIPAIWQQVRNDVNDIRPTLPAGVVGPVLQRPLRRHLRHHLRLHRRRVHPARAA